MIKMFKLILNNEYLINKLRDQDLLVKQLTEEVNDLRNQMNDLRNQMKDANEFFELRKRIEEYNKTTKR